MQKTLVQSLGQEDPPEEGMATHSSILAWKIPWTEQPGRLIFHGVTKSQTRLSDITFFFHILGFELMLLFFLIILFIICFFFFFCAGCSLLCAGFLWLQGERATL